MESSDFSPEVMSDRISQSEAVALPREPRGEV